MRAFARDLENCRTAALTFFDRIKSDPRFLTGLNPELDIIVWTIKADRASEASRLNDAVFEERCGSEFTSCQSKFAQRIIRRVLDKFRSGTKVHHLLEKRFHEAWNHSDGLTGLWTTFSKL